ncbi:hypothetical protein [Pseudomonas fluorescens]|uniref:hypothetical protein n=1 Tax=Pseudomonas fluorescens TaxID=294 RepID=UPI0030D92C0E
MNIEITERQTPHVWVVHLDGWDVNFRSVKTAQDFVDVLQARINAPHVWHKWLCSDANEADCGSSDGCER